VGVWCTTNVEPERDSVFGLGFSVMELPDTLLGFETTGPLSLRPVWETGDRQTLRLGVGFLSGSLVVVALLWWWGVVFDLWIVVASI
jgi:hypothetical protein